MARRKTKLSDRQKSMLEMLQRFQVDNGYPPTIREIGDELKISSTSVVNYNLERLEERGYIERESRLSRGIRILKPLHDAAVSATERAKRALGGTFSVPVVGRIAAGIAINVPETDFSIFDAESTVDLPQGLLPQRVPVESLFALEVQGDSMIDALVDDGDIVVLRKTEDLRNGDMVAAWLTEEESTTLKYLFREQGHVRLQPANPAYEPVILEGPDALVVQGKVVMVIRPLEQ
jgi:repressor LexA